MQLHFSIDLGHLHPHPAGILVNRLLGLGVVVSELDRFVSLLSGFFVQLLCFAGKPNPPQTIHNQGFDSCQLVQEFLLLGNPGQFLECFHRSSPP